MDELQQDWDRQSELLERILDGEPVEDVLASEPDAAVREAVLSMLQHHREAEKTGFLDAPPTLVRALHEGTDGPSLRGGERLTDRFVILRHIGSGGMGEVYLARDEVMNDDVALKIIRPELSEDPRIRTRFIAEVRNARRVTHTNVCHVYDIVERAELPFFTMEYLPGRTLAEALGAGSLDGAAKKRIAAQLANGLDAAHLRGIIHRDFKPANVMLTERNGRLDAVIMDFGLARTEEMTDPGNAHSLQAGTEEYMAPELLQGSKATLQSDVYAYGKVLQQLLPNHPLLSKLLAERPEDRQPSLRAVIASFDDANGKATRRTWMLGTAAAAATGYSAWRLLNPPPPPPPIRQRLFMSDLTHPNGAEQEGRNAQGLLVLALQQSPLLAVLVGRRLETELKKAGITGTLSSSVDRIQEIVARLKSGYVMTGSIEPVGAGLAMQIRLTPAQRPHDVVLIHKNVGGRSQLTRLVEEAALQLRRDIGESDLAIRNSYSPLEQVTSASPEAVQYYFEAVRTYEMADADSSLVYLQRAIEIDPDFTLAHHYRSLSLSAKGRRGEALRSSQTAFIRRSKLAPRERLWVEAVYYTFQEDRPRALEAYRSAVLLFPEDPVLQRQYAAAHCQLGNFEEGITASRRALDLDPFSENTRSELIVNLAEAMRYEEALREYSRFVARGDTSTLLNWGSGLAYMGLGDYRKAAKQFEAMAVTANRRRWARLLSVGPLLLSGDWSRAKSQLEADLAEDEYGVDVTRRLARVEWLGWTNLLLGYTASAQECAQQLLGAEAGPHNTDFFRSAARIAIRTHDSRTYDSAVDMLRREHRRYPTPALLSKIIHCESEMMFRSGNQNASSDRILRAAAIQRDLLVAISAAKMTAWQDRRSDPSIQVLRGAGGTILKYQWPGFLAMTEAVYQWCLAQERHLLNTNQPSSDAVHVKELSNSQVKKLVDAA